jgi:hypothetical protein
LWPNDIPALAPGPTTGPHNCGIPRSGSRRLRGNISTPKPTLAFAKDAGADLTKTNVNGGAIAIGHPLGASGARVMTTMVNALEQRGGRYAVQTMGGGLGREPRAQHSERANFQAPTSGLTDGKTILPEWAMVFIACSTR